MSEADRQTCPSCGDPVTTVVAGLCPRCLLGNALGGETDAGGGIVVGGTGDTREDRTTVAPTTPPETHGQIRLLIDDVAPTVRQSSSEGPAAADHPARLELSGEIGRGGMGVVLRGRDPNLGRELAVKVLRDDLRDSPEMVRRFVEEARIAGQLQHPGIVPIHELGTFADDRPYFTMKLVKGRTLSRILAEGVAPETDRARGLGIFEQVCQTVAYAHAHGVIHRDLKPSNVMVGSFGEVQVMDWGLAKVLRRGGANRGAGPGDGHRHGPQPGRLGPVVRGLGPGHAELHGAGAGARRDRGGRRAGRRLRAGLDPLRDPDRAAGLHGSEDRRHPAEGGRR